MHACCRPLKISPRQGLRLFLWQQVLLLFAGSAWGLGLHPGATVLRRQVGDSVHFFLSPSTPAVSMLGPESNAFSVPFILSSALWVNSPSAILTTQGRELRLREL